MKRKPYRFFLYLLLECSNIIILLLPYRVIVFLGGFFGGLSYYFLPKYRNIALENLRLAFKDEKSEKEIRDIVKGVFRNLGMTGVEYASLRKFNRKSVKRILTEEGANTFKKILSEGKGLIAISSHFCNWEMAAVCTSAFDLDVSVIARRVYYPPYNKFLVSLRESQGVKTIYRDDKNVLRKSLAVVRSNEVLAIVPDQDVDSVDGVFVNFFGRPAYTPSGPVVMAMLSGAPIVVSVIVRDGGKFRLVTSDPIYIQKSGDRKKDIIKYTQQWTDILEEYIRRYPYYWVWIHKRWKTQPKVNSV
ncbi:MAG: lysophospholipid acyltransferase family protein [Candidatus Omnitrophica bacterium]|nr:lysophospholipid acyltransferase family protein [Candidatus Omnitrophota bacterium]MBU4488636.1 lysophospholipid acyltransferase family protein [Candidatus Omnitrophota bacterium]